MCLTGRMMDAEEAERCGLVSRIVPKGELTRRSDPGCKTDCRVLPPDRDRLTKESVNRAYETTLVRGRAF